MILAEKISEERKKNGWNQEELAEKLSVSRQSVSKWESGQSVPDLNRILEMARIFGVTTDYLLKDEIEEAENVLKVRKVLRSFERLLWKRQMNFYELRLKRHLS